LPDNPALFFTASFGNLHRVDLLGFLDFDFYVRSGRAKAGNPFDFWIRIDLAIPACFKIGNFIAVVALVDDRVAEASGVAAAFFTHKAAFHSFFYSITKHFI